MVEVARMKLRGSARWLTVLALGIVACGNDSEEPASSGDEVAQSAEDGSDETSRGDSGDRGDPEEQDGSRSDPERPGDDEPADPPESQGGPDPDDSDDPGDREQNDAPGRDAEDTESSDEENMPAPVGGGSGNREDDPEMDSEEPPDGEAEATPIHNPLTDPATGPAAGNPEGACAIPAEAGLEDSSSPDHVIGDGSPGSCTGEAVISAVAQGGVITFDCGPDPLTITLEEPARIYNDADPDVVIDGGGLITLSGGGENRILYMNTCDESLVYTTPHCDDQDHPRLTVQNITFADGNSKSEEQYDGGGAIWSRGGRIKLVNTRFFNNVCADEGPDVGGAAVRVFDQSEDQPVYVVNSTFGGADGFGNVCSNGGGISSIGVSWTILNTVFSHNRAIGEGGNPAEGNTPGGGSGGAIYNDGQTMTLSVCGTLIEDNEVNAYGSAIFFVSNNHDGTIEIRDSVIRNNTGGGWNVLPSISMHDDTEQIIEGSVIE